MQFNVEPASHDEIREVLRVMFRAYEGKNEYINAVFPRGLTEEGLEITYQRLLFVTKKVPSITWEKATDKTTGEIVGGSMWTLYEHAKPRKFPLDGPEGTWENEVEKEYAQAMFNGVGDDEERFWTEKGLPIMRLTVLAVDPLYQCQGIGAELLKSGLKIVDRVGAVTTVIATLAGKRLYDKHNFKVLREGDLIVPDKFADRPKYHFWIMGRDKGGT